MQGFWNLVPNWKKKICWQLSKGGSCQNRFKWWLRREGSWCSVETEVSLKPPFMIFVLFPFLGYWLPTTALILYIHTWARVGESLLLPQVTSFQPPLSWELSPLIIQRQFPAMPPSLHHWFLARSKPVSLSCSSFPMLQSAHFLL